MQGIRASNLTAAQRNDAQTAFRRQPRLTLLPVLVALLCAAAMNGCSRGSQEPSPTPSKAPGPQLVVFIIDRTASTSKIQEPLLKYASDALSEYSKEGPMHLILINLDEKPSMDIEKSGDLTSDDVDDVVSHIKQIDYKGKGTDIVGAFDKAYEYYTYEKAPPKAFRILCFTDGLVESLTGQKFRPWSKLDAEKFKKASASIGVYFLASSARGEVEKALAGLGALIKEEGESKTEAKNEEYDLPGIAK